MFMPQKYIIQQLGTARESSWHVLRACTHPLAGQDSLYTSWPQMSCTAGHKTGVRGCALSVTNNHVPSNRSATLLCSSGQHSCVYAGPTDTLPCKAAYPADGRAAVSCSRRSMHAPWTLTPCKAAYYTDALPSYAAHEFPGSWPGEGGQGMTCMPEHQHMAHYGWAACT